MIKKPVFSIAACIVSCLILVFGLSPRSSRINADAAGDEAIMSRHALVQVGPGSPPKEIVLHIGDALMVQPFRIPVIPEYLNASVDVGLSGDQVLEPIGKSQGLPAGEGGFAPGAFLYAIAEGRSTLQAMLVDRKGCRIEDYQATYTVIVRKPPPRISGARSG